MKTTFANPDSAEREYTRAMIRYVRAIERDWNALARDALPGIVAAYDIAARADAWTDGIVTLIADFLRRALASGQIVIDKLPSQFNVISNFNEVQFKAVFKANTGMELPPLVQGAPRSLLGVDVFRSEPFIAPLAEGWIAENTALIKDVPAKVASDIEGIIRRGTMSGKSVRVLQKEIKARWPIADKRARLIAQDQTLKANADLTRYRLQSVGVSEYIWRTVGDDRVRPTHMARNGDTFSWDEPPPDGHPGQPVRCRCRSEAIWPD